MIESRKGKKDEEIATIFASVLFQQPGIYGVGDNSEGRIGERGRWVPILEENILFSMWESLALPISPHPDCGGRQLSQAGGEGGGESSAKFQHHLARWRK